MFDLLIQDITTSKNGKPMDKVVLKKWPKALAYQNYNPNNKN